jgi:hypothetical protein
VRSYVCPIRCDRPCGPAAHAELFAYLAEIAETAEVIVVDGSAPRIFAVHAASCPGGVRHLAPEGPRSRNGKVDGVRTGILAARAEAVVIADDDVRYTPDVLGEVSAMLDGADLVVPQNAFSLPMPWHARWDTARTLLNRSWGIDYPGTLAIRRSRFVAMGGYDGDVLFENLELLRTVRAHGGTVRSAPGSIVERLPPDVRAFVRQRPRQAYDDLAQPWKLAVWLAVAPVSAWALVRRRGRIPAAAAAGAGALAAHGRRGEAVFPPSCVAFAPLWLAERAVCSWIAMVSRFVLGGCRYRGAIIRRAATPNRVLRARMRARQIPGPTDPSDRVPVPPIGRATRRTGASSATVRSGRAARSPAGR